MSLDQEDTLEVLTTYASSVEAGFSQQILREAGLTARLGSEAAATALSYVGTAVGGVRLLVRKSELAEAARVLSEHPALDEGEFLERGKEEGWWGEEEEEPEDEPAEGAVPEQPSPELRRAYHAAIFGLFVFPLMVQLYSLYLIFRHRLFLPDRGGNDWRFYVAMIVNVAGLYFTKVFWSWGNQLPLE